MVVFYFFIELSVVRADCVLLLLNIIIKIAMPQS